MLYLYNRYMNTFRDILVNLLSNAIWAWGAVLFTSLFTFFKKSCRVDKMYLIKWYIFPLPFIFFLYRLVLVYPIG